VAKKIFRTGGLELIEPDAYPTAFLTRTVQSIAPPPPVSIVPDFNTRWRLKLRRSSVARSRLRVFLTSRFWLACRIGWMGGIGLALRLAARLWFEARPLSISGERYLEPD
jgi:hypothetical protein